MRKRIIPMLGAITIATWSGGDILAVEPTTTLATTLNPAISFNAAGRQQLKGHLTTAMMQTQIVGRVPAETPWTLTIGLSVKDMKDLFAAADQVSDPKSPSFRKYVTPEQFADRFGATNEDYQKLLDWARSKNLAATAHSNRLIATVSGSVADIETALDIHLYYRTRPDGTQFFAPDVEPSLDLTVPVEHVGGLENFVLPKRAGGSGQNGGYQGTDFRNAYAPSTALTGAGQLIGIFMFDGFAQRDITGYGTQTGQSFLPVQTVPANSITTPGIEGTLDIEMALSMAPAAQIVAFVGSSSNSTLILTNMTDRKDIKQFSSSWFWYNGTFEDEALIAQLDLQGQSFFQATGDGGAFQNGSFSNVASGTLDIRQFPYITLVGGTSLSMADDGAAYGTLETAWSGSSGGYIASATLPWWQAAVAGDNGASLTNRNFPDVSAQAAGANIFLNGGIVGVGGTSQATPLWAGFMALVNENFTNAEIPTVGFINPAMYAIATTSAYSASFHDVQSGCTPNGGGTQYCSGVGYDLTTGLGSPNSGLINALLPTSPPLCTTPVCKCEAEGGILDPSGSCIIIHPPPPNCGGKGRPACE
jgi:subtilase family serine protease